MSLIAPFLFALALIHTFSVKIFSRAAHRYPRHEGLFHLLSEIEVVFGFWSLVLIIVMAWSVSPADAVNYLESRNYTEPLFVIVVMVIAASQPILSCVQKLVASIARGLPLPTELAFLWLSLSAVPLLGSLITEPAAMTLAALTLKPQLFKPSLPEWLKYGLLGTLFVNVSIGGTLTSYAAPPVLMVAQAWQWDTAFMAQTFGWKSAIAVLANATLVTGLLHVVSKRAAQAQKINQAVISVDAAPEEAPKFSWWVGLIHVAFLAGVVMTAHHPVVFLSLFLFFLGFTQAYPAYQTPLMLKEGLMVGFFLAGLVVLGGMQHGWLQPLISSLSPHALFFGAMGLTALTDNAALTYLGSLVEGMSDAAKYMLMAGAVAGGGLTIIANAPNPAGAALLKQAFQDESIGAGSLLLAALPSTLVAALFFLGFQQ